VGFTIKNRFLLLQIQKKTYFVEDTPELERERTRFLNRVFISLGSLRRGSFSSNAAQDFTLPHEHFLMSHPIEGNGNNHVCATNKQLQNLAKMLRRVGVDLQCISNENELTLISSSTSNRTWPPANLMWGIQLYSILEGNLYY